VPYDPQANHRRPAPADAESAPVEALLGSTQAKSRSGAEAGPSATNDDPPPSPSVTPEPADPPPDALLINTGLASAVAALVGLFVLRHLWRRHCNRRAETGDQ